MIYSSLKVGHAPQGTYGATTKYNALTVDLVTGTGWRELDWGEGGFGLSLLSLTPLT